MKNRFFNSLHFRIFLIVISAALPLVLFLVYQSSQERNREVELLKERAIEMVDFTLMEEAQALDAARQVLISVSSLPKEFFMNPSLCSNYLIGLQAKYKRYVNLGVVDENGMLYASAQSQKNMVDYSKAEFFREVKSNKGFSVGEYVIDSVSNKRIVNLGYPVTVKWNKNRSVVFASLDVTYIDELEEGLTKIFPGKSLFIKIDNEGDILATNFISSGDMKHFITPSLLSGIINQKNGIIEGNGPGNQQYLYVFAATSSKLFHQELYLIVGVQKEDFFAEINEALLKNLLLVGFLFVLILVATLLFSGKYILGNIKKLINAAREMSAGNLGVRSGVDYRIGELGQLAMTFDQMVESLEEQNNAKMEYQKSLQDNEENYRKLVEDSPDAIAIYADGKIVYANHSSAKLMRASAVDELIGKNVIEFVHRDYKEFVIKRTEEMIRSGKSAPLEEEKFIRLDGTIVCVEVKATPILYNKKPAVQTIVRDITERKHAEESLRESERQFHALFEQAGDFSFIFGPDDQGTPVVVDASESACLAHGYSRDELIGMSLWRLEAHELSREEKLEIVQKVLTGETLRFETLHRRKDGTVFPVEVVSRSVQITGKPALVYSTLRDITERKKAEAQIRFQASILEQVNNGVAATDLDGKIIYWNSYAEILHGWKAEEVLGKYAIDFLVSKGNRGTAIEILSSVFAKENADIEIPMMKKNGEEFPAHVSYTLLKNESGEPIGILGISDDITERKLAEEKLLVANERLRFLVYNNPAVIFSGKASGDFGATYISENVAPRLGYMPEEFLNDPYFWQNHVHPDDVKSVLNAMSDLSINDNHVLEYRFLHKDGKYHWIRDESKLIRDENGKPLELIGYWVDITEIKQAEKELKEAHDLFQNTVSSLEDAIFLIDPETRIIYNCNPAAERIFGYAPDEIVGKTTLPMYVDKTMYDEFGHQMEESLKGSGFFHTEYKLKRKNGEIFPSEHYVKPLINEDGKIVMVLSLVRDITRRKKAQELIKYQSTLFENVHDAILATDKDYKITAWNLAAEELYGWKKNEVMGKVVQDVIHSEFSQVERERALKLLNSGKFFTTEVIQIRKDGSSIYVEGTTMPIYDEHNDLTGYVSMNRDISERIKVEKEKEKLFSEIRDTSTQLKILSSRLLETQETERKNIARELHDEIGQTLTAMKLNLQSAYSLSKSSKIHSVLSESINFADKTLKQVRNLSLSLHPSMLDDLGIVPTIQWFINMIVSTNKLEVEFTAVPKDIILSKDIEITCYRIIQEAITNILKHSRAKKVLILLKRSEDSVDLRITDDGVGFDVELARKDAVKGKSLGILSMDERASLSNGTFNIKSVPNKGTTVEVSFNLGKKEY